MTQVWDRLFIGGLSDVRQIADSNPFAITSVIALCREPIRIRRHGISYLSFSVEEAHPMAARQLDAILDALWENIRWGRVLVASKDGSSLVPVIAAAWMRTVGFKDIDAALAEIGKLHIIEPNPILLKSIRKAIH